MTGPANPPFEVPPKPDPPQHIDAVVAQLAETLVRMQGTSRVEAQSLRSNEKNRLNMLIVHAIAAIVIAPLFVLSKPIMKGPLWDLILNKIPYFPYCFGCLLFIGGMILLPASLMRLRMAELFGLSLISLWYTMLAIGFGWPAVLSLHRWLAHEPQPPGALSVYAWAVYGHLAVVMRVHMYTVWKMMRRDGTPTTEAERETSR